MKIKWSKSFFVTVALVMVGAGFGMHYVRQAGKIPIPMMPGKNAAWLKYHQDMVDRLKYNQATPTYAPPPLSSNQINQVPRDLRFREKANELTDAEKVELTNLFATKLK